MAIPVNVIRYELNRFALIWGEPLFCLKDVCAALMLEGKHVTRRLGDGVVSKHPIVDRLGRTQEVSFINEDGIYDVVLETFPYFLYFRREMIASGAPLIQVTECSSVQLKYAYNQKTKRVYREVYRLDS